MNTDTSNQIPWNSEDNSSRESLEDKHETEVTSAEVREEDAWEERLSAAEESIEPSSSQLVNGPPVEEVDPEARVPDALDILEQRELQQQQQQQRATASSSRADSVRRLKSATLDRMGRILKIHSKSTGEKSDIVSTSANNEEMTRKQKFNSLTRMLRFPDKPDKSKSASQYRGRSLTRILRKKGPIEGDNPPDKPDEHMRGIFSRILGQIRGRSSRNDSVTESTSQRPKEKSSRSKSPSSTALTDMTLESSCPVLGSHQTA